MAARHSVWTYSQLQPLQAATKSTPAGPGFMEHARGDWTRYSRVAKSAKACAVHKLASNPSTSGPRWGECTMRRNSAPRSSGLRSPGLTFSQRHGHNAPLAPPAIPPLPTLPVLDQSGGPQTPQLHHITIPACATWVAHATKSISNSD